MPEIEIRPADAAELAIVRLRVSMACAAEAARRLALPGALRSSASADHLALWLAPDQWLLVAERVGAVELVDRCARVLGELLHLAVDASAAMQRFSIAGPRARELLAMGSGLDWAPDATPPGFATRTRLARIAVVVHVAAAQAVDLYIERSHADYFERWIRYALSDPLTTRGTER